MPLCKDEHGWYSILEEEYVFTYEDKDGDWLLAGDVVGRISFKESWHTCTKIKEWRWSSWRWWAATVVWGHLLHRWWLPTYYQAGEVQKKKSPDKKVNRDPATLVAIRIVRRFLKKQKDHVTVFCLLCYEFTTTANVEYTNTLLSKILCEAWPGSDISSIYICRLWQLVSNEIAWRSTISVRREGNI